MFQLHVSYYGSDDRLQLPLEPEGTDGLWGLDATIDTPGGEKLRLNVALFEGNRSVTLNAWFDGGDQYLQVGGFFLRESAFSPSVSVRSPRGQLLQLLLGESVGKG